ncbi:unnamed protein product [Cuscuta campestris]|uniref:Sulfite exporter TauE/SafE family protein n=1 Tax=Cuscuta campestris TaxID=132261 RepID=A0A484LZH0_9ASTE|nr:unnamed protein product [Cuscuta campestris]
MHSSGILKFQVPLILLILCNAEEAAGIFSNSIHQFPTQSGEGNFTVGAPVVVAGILSFIAATISSAGGIGGGGLYIPILTIVAGLDLKTASGFSAFMVTGGIVSNVVCNLFMQRGGKVLVDLDIALLSEPSMLLGVSIGVICNGVFPEWLITVLFAVFLVWSTFSTCRSGILYWKLETETRNGDSEMETALVVDKEERSCEEDGLCCRVDGSRHGMKLGMLLMIWLCFFALHLFRGNRYGHGIVHIEACGVVYWIISAIHIPLAVSLTAWILFNNQRWKTSSSQDQEEEKDTRKGPNKFLFPVMALMAGVLGGVFGVGGGMLISPLLIQLGIPPQITSATCSFMVLFSSTMSVVQYVLLGMDHIGSAVAFATICFVASVIGLVVVQRAIERHGRASIIVFSVGTVMALSTVLMTSLGAVRVWKDYTSGRYMGFKLPC